MKFWTFMAAMMALLAVTLSFHHAFMLPEVHFDPAGECVRVMDAGHIKTCARIPERHVRVVVAGRVS